MLIEHLFNTYGRIMPQQVKTWELEILNLPFDFSHPVDMVFNAIINLIELAERAGIPLSPDQCTNLAYVIFAQQPVFLQDLCAWNKKIPGAKTWINMKTHMRKAQNKLSLLPIDWKFLS